MPIEGYGTAEIKLRGRGGSTTKLRLYNAALCSGFASSLISLRQLRQRGIWWDISPHNNCLRRSNSSYLCALQEHHHQQVLEYQPLKNEAALAVIALIPQAVDETPKPQQQHKYTTATRRKPIRGSTPMWHRRLGHPGPEAIRHLVGSSRGVRLLTGGSAISTIDYDVCGTSKLHRQVRRAVKEALLREKPADRIAIDFHDYDKGYKGYRYTLLVTDQSSSYTWDFYLTRRTTDVLLTVITNFLTLLSTQYRAQVKVIETDNEILKHPGVVSEIESRGIRLKPYAPNTQAQNGGAERIAATIKQRAQAMASGAKLPDILWPEATKASTYLYNRTPTASRCWRTPYEVFHKHF